jgi:protein-L-isoaspartate(D-aspartate) O-methyltransferase
VPLAVREHSLQDRPEPIEADFRETASATGLAQLDLGVRAALERVPRHRFVPAYASALAYANRPLSIGQGQTISQPFIVALMTQLLALGKDDRVLEVGTGSGYQAAVLAELAAQVYTVEIVRALGEAAAALLRELGYENIEARVGDGFQGWPEAAPFDAILVTAAPDELPAPLVDQLAPGGRLVVPVGPQRGIQDLLLVRKDLDGRTLTRNLLPVRFVPLTRELR